jgi:hypothetical protein
VSFYFIFCDFVDKSFRKFVSVHLYYPNGKHDGAVYEAKDPAQVEEELRSTLTFNCSTMEGLELPSATTYRQGQVSKSLSVDHLETTNISAGNVLQPQQLAPWSYPRNLGMNIALKAATTYLVMISESVTLIPRPEYCQIKILQVLKMAKKNYMNEQEPAVFVLPSFRVSTKTNQYALE